MKESKDFKTSVKLINKLNQEELKNLHKIVWQRLKFLHKQKSKQAIKKFQVFDHVYFQNKNKRQRGIITRLNQKTAIVTLDNGERWKISPMLLRKVKGQKNLLKALLGNKKR